MNRVVKFIGAVGAGFPSPAKDYSEKEIDLAGYLQPNNTSIYLARVIGDSMTGSNIPDKSIVVIDKSLTPGNNSIVIATVNGELLIKHFVQTRGGTFLNSANPLHKPIRITEELDFSIWGVVTHAIVDFKTRQ